MNTTKTPTSYLFDDDYVDTDFGQPKEIDNAAIRKEAHIANGGEQEFKCPACRGTGAFYGYSGRYVGPCFKCKGRKTISKGQMAAIKGKETKRQNIETWQEEHREEIAYMRKRADKGSTFYAGMLEKLQSYGTLFDSNIEAARRDMVKDAEFYARKKAEREAARPKVDMTAVEALFAKAVENDHKKPIFRAAEITLSHAPATGRNPGALYVNETVAGKGVHGEYLGKIVDGKFIAKWGTNEADTMAKLMLVAEDPGKEAIRYASKFSACGICGTPVVNPVSIRSVIGPICARKFGLEYLREAAADELKKEKAEEQAARERGEII